MRFRKENPVAGAGLLVVPAQNQLVALDAATGRVVWIHRAKTAQWWPHVGPRGVFVTDGNRTLYRLDAENGKELWRRTMRESAFASRYYEGSPLASAGALLIVHDGQTLFALDPETGQTRWHRKKVQDVAVGNSLIVVRAADPGVADSGYHLAAVQLDGKQRWRATLPEDASLLSPPVIADDDAMVVVRPHDEVLYGYDAANGKLLWTFDLDDGERVVETGSAPLLIHSARR
jgi:glucose dehydrogenase